MPTSCAEEKEEWALRSRGLEGWGELRDEDGICCKQATKDKIRGWPKEQWARIWDNYMAGLHGGRSLSTSRADGLEADRLKLHKNLLEAESSVLIQARTGKIGLAEFLFQARVPGFFNSGCRCGYRKQDVRHVVIFCPNFADRNSYSLSSHASVLQPHLL